MAKSRRETFTIWMKSLVMQGNGYTVYNSDGDIVYRIDNYDNKSSSQVHLMDLQGRVLFTILQRKLRVFGRWEGYKYCSGSGSGSGSGSLLMGAVDKEMMIKKPCFQVRRHCRILGGSRGSSCEVTVRPNIHESNSCHNYRIEVLDGKSTFRIVESEGGGVMAAVTKKQTPSGVVLGDDVLKLVVEPHVDHSLVMALVAVCGLIHHTI